MMEKIKKLNQNVAITRPKVIEIKKDALKTPHEQMALGVHDLDEPASEVVVQGQAEDLFLFDGKRRKQF